MSGRLEGKVALITGAGAGLGAQIARRFRDEGAAKIVINDLRLEAATAKSLGPGDAVPLGRDIVHSVTNPTAGFTGAIHVYGGNFFTAERSEWDPQTLRQQPYDIEKAMKLFEDANSR